MKGKLELYPHQREGVEWIRSKRAAFLADDMRLGKTITSLVAARGISHPKILVVCPSVVLWNWKAEAEKWVDAKVQVIDNGRVELDHAAEVVVVTHGLLLNPWILSQLLEIEWDVLIVDEAHAFKSPQAKRTIALYNTLVESAARVWLLSGTPCPNNVAELYTHIRALLPERIPQPGMGRPMTYDEFVDHFCIWRMTDWGKKIVANKQHRLPELKAILKGFLFRRRMEDVFRDLPPMRHEVVHLRPLKLDKALRDLDGLIAPRLQEAIGAAISSSVMFQTLLNGFDDTEGEDLARFRRLCGQAKVTPIVELLSDELVQDTEKVVIFAHHSDVIEGIAEGLGGFGVRTITGATPAKERTRRVADFQTDPNVRVIVCNIQAGGVGIALHAAHEIVFVEQSWTPGDNEQASRRCCHAEQKHPVRIRFMALADTVDALVMDANRDKLEMVNEALGE